MYFPSFSSLLVSDDQTPPTPLTYYSKPLSELRYGIARSATMQNLGAQPWRKLATHHSTPRDDGRRETENTQNKRKHRLNSIPAYTHRVHLILELRRPPYRFLNGTASSQSGVLHGTAIDVLRQPEARALCCSISRSYSAFSPPPRKGQTSKHVNFRPRL